MNKNIHHRCKNFFIVGGLVLAVCGCSEAPKATPTENTIEREESNDSVRQSVQYTVDSVGAEKASSNSETVVGEKTANLDSAALLARGKILFLRCRSCHTLEEGGRHMVGPNLHGMFGSEAGKKGGFTYSEALARSGIVWSEETLGEWLEKPNDYLPGNKMAFAGVPKLQDRAALIAYLKEETR